MTKTAMSENAVHVIGGGLAGSEAAFQIAQRGVPRSASGYDLVSTHKNASPGAGVFVFRLG